MTRQHSYPFLAALLSATCLSLMPVTALAEPAPLPVSLKELASGAVEVPLLAVAAGAAPVGKCKVNAKISVDNQHHVLDLKSLGTDPLCQPLLANPPTPLDVAVVVGASVVEVKLTPSVANGAAPFLLAARGDEVFGTSAAGQLQAVGGVAPALYWLSGKEWRTLDAVGGKIKLPSELIAEIKKSAAHFQVFVNFNPSGMVTAGAAAPAEIDGSLLTAVDTGSRTDSEEPPHDWCKRNAVGYTVCLDFYDDALGRGKRRRLSVYPNDTNHVLLPNTSIRVVVLRRRAATTTMDLGGVEGVFTSTDRNNTGTPGLQTSKPGYDIDDQEFAPRLPGAANLTVTVTENGKEEARTVEFVVELTYVGAVRVGAAMVFNATDRAYEARAVAGSKQSEIAATKKSKQDLELVVGYSAYLSPRGYANSSWTNFEPYVGIGVLNQGPTALETLKSLHFGIEWEPSANFGIAATGVVRRVNRLADGYHIGSPISGGVPTVEKAEVGFGLVFNLSPDFLRIARQSGSSFFK